MQFIFDFFQSITWGRFGLGLGLFIVSVVLSILVMGVVMVNIPAHYFSSHYQHDFLPGSTWIVRWGALILKNLAGLLLVIAGIAMLIGPGQGILTILIGLILMDIPGKRPLEARLIRRPAILSSVNKLRARYNKPPLLMD